MPSLSDVTKLEFQQALTGTTLRVSQIIYIALTAGVLAFAFAVIVLLLVGDPREPGEAAFTTANMLTLVNVLLALTLPAMGWVLNNRQFSAARAQDASTQQLRNAKGELVTATPAERCIMLMRTSSIIQLATLEGCAFFGLMVCINATSEGVAHAEPAYLFNMLTSLPLFGYVIGTFPTAERLTSVFETRIQNNR